MRPRSPITTPEPSRSRPSVAALRASGIACTESLTMAAKSFSASTPSTTLAAAASFLALDCACAAGAATSRPNASVAMSIATHIRTFGHHSRTSQMGYSRADYQGKPIIAIINTWSDINACHAHFRQRAEEVKRGVLQAGGFPLEMPAIALAEVFQKPTTMLYRNLLAMETEELLRSYPVDGAVLMGGCDKTTPALLMGAISMNLPAIFMPAGPMLSGRWRDQQLGSGSDVWKNWAELRAGNITRRDWREIENGA